MPTVKDIANAEPVTMENVFFNDTLNTFDLWTYGKGPFK